MQSLGTNRLRKLLVDWFRYLGQEAGLPFGQYGSSADAFSVGNPTEFHVRAEFVADGSLLRFMASDPNMQHQVDEIAERARLRISAGDLGSGVWYTTTYQELAFTLSAYSGITELVMRMGNQVRILGWRRLGANVLLEFKEDSADVRDLKEPALLAPKAAVDAHFVIPGPCAGEFSNELVRSVSETVKAICSLALGRPLQLAPALFPSQEKEIPELTRRRQDPQILTLARKHISLDIFGSLIALGDVQSHQRARAAILTYDAALSQERDPVATILYVVTCEALSVPFASWQTNKPTKRFIEFLDGLISSDLDEIVRHANFEHAFGIQKGSRQPRALRRELLDRIYELRSGFVHQGLGPSYTALFGELAGGGMRRGLLARIAEMAILRFIASPRSSIIGHPVFEAST